jgi:hypothetical protein
MGLGKTLGLPNPRATKCRNLWQTNPRAHTPSGIRLLLYSRLRVDEIDLRELMLGALHLIMALELQGLREATQSRHDMPTHVNRAVAAAAAVSELFGVPGN